VVSSEQLREAHPRRLMAIRERYPAQKYEPLFGAHLKSIGKDILCSWELGTGPAVTSNYFTLIHDGPFTTEFAQQSKTEWQHMTEDVLPDDTVRVASELIEAVTRIADADRKAGNTSQWFDERANLRELKVSNGQTEYILQLVGQSPEYVLLVGIHDRLVLKKQRCDLRIDFAVRN
jgi:hypothetical protein